MFTEAALPPFALIVAPAIGSIFLIGILPVTVVVWAQVITKNRTPTAQKQFSHVHLILIK